MRRNLHVTVTEEQMAQLTRSPIVLTAAALVMLMFAAPGTRAQTMGDPEEFTAFAVNMGAYVVGTTANVIITVNRWTPAAERDQLFTTLREKGPQGFFNAVRDARRVGTLRTPNTVGYELRFAIDDPGKDGGRHVLIGTDRPIGFYEATNRPPSYDYPLTIIEMNLGPDGKGEGTMSVAAKLIPAGKNVVIENFDTQPVRLNRIETRKLTKR
jgi:hypothetical protein